MNATMLISTIMDGVNLAAGIWDDGLFMGSQPSSGSRKESDPGLWSLMKWKQPSYITVEDLAKSKFSDKISLQLMCCFTREWWLYKNVPEFVFISTCILLFRFPLNYFSASTVQKYAQKNPSVTPQVCWSWFCVVLFIRTLRKVSVLFASYNKIAANGNDSKMVLCSQRLTCQNIEGADFCGGNSAAPFVPTGTSSSSLWKQIILLGSLFSSLVEVYVPCVAFVPILPFSYSPPAHRDTSRTSAWVGNRSNQQVNQANHKVTSPGNWTLGLTNVRQVAITEVYPQL